MKQPQLHTYRTILRELRSDDAEKIYFIRTDPDLNQYVNKPQTNSIEEAENFIDKIIEGVKNHQNYYWVIELKEDKAFAGTICLWNFNKEKNSIETGYVLLPGFQGKGIMTEALEAISQFAFNELKTQFLEAYTHRDNKASTKLLDKCGFKLMEGILPKEEEALIVYSKSNPLLSPA